MEILKVDTQLYQTTGYIKWNSHPEARRNFKIPPSFRMV